MPVPNREEVSQGGEMSIIGHSIQSGVVNVHSALKEQQAGQAAQADEDARRQASIRRAEELAREGVAETNQTRQKRIQNPPERERNSGGRRGEPDGGEEGKDADNSAHLDLFA